MDRTDDFCLLGLGSYSKIIGALKIEPEFCIEVTRKPEGCVGGDAAPFVDNIQDPRCRNPEFQREAVHAHAKRAQVVLAQRLARMREGDTIIFLFRPLDTP